MLTKQDEVLEWLYEQIRFAQDSYNESFRLAPNSYGAGYDFGRYVALCEARDMLEKK